MLSFFKPIRTGSIPQPDVPVVYNKPVSAQNRRELLRLKTKADKSILDKVKRQKNKRSKKELREAMLREGLPIIALSSIQQASTEIVEKSVLQYRVLKTSFPKLTFETAHCLIKENHGFESVTLSSLKRWVHKDDQAISEGVVEPKKRGRIVNDVFEREVIHQLFVTELLLTKDGKPRELIIVANTAFTYEMFQIAGKRVQSFPEFIDDPDVQRLTFSHGWVYNLQKRAELRRRATTTHQKPKPTVEVVRAAMKGIQSVIIKNNIKPEHVFNEDETAVFGTAEILAQYVPASADRAINPGTGSEDRITALLGTSTKGKSLPLMLFVKVSTENKYDLSNERTLDKLLKSGALPVGKWARHVFEVELINKKGQLIKYKRPYLQDSDTLDIVTVQHKAWNGSFKYLIPTILMYTMTTFVLFRYCWYDAAGGEATQASEGAGFSE